MSRKNSAYSRNNPSQTQIDKGWVSSRFVGEHEDGHKDWEEHLCPNDFESEVEDEDAMSVSANVGCRYPCLCPVFIRDAKVKIDDFNVCVCRPEQAGTDEGSTDSRAIGCSHLLDIGQIGYRRENKRT